ncbi:MAG: hypothetical protein MI923_10645 [Phycisphaerales bacterium]|nr:hypothetical protein [Phycisphaerales bacterium]
MNYVLAGAGYLAVVSVFTGGRTVQRQNTPTALVLRDWLPFAISAAITAGVAPLLFIQILYKENFYTANLLLSHRWMAIVPVLIVGFYLSYLLKSKTIERWPSILRVLVGVGVFACFLFTAYSWTENHLLSTEDPGTWSDFYVSPSFIYQHPQLLPRMLLWSVGAIPTMVTLVAWQLRYKTKSDRVDSLSSENRRLSLLALAGIVLSLACGGFYYSAMDSSMDRIMTSSLALLYLIIAVLGLMVQSFSWTVVLLRQRLDFRWLTITTIGLVMTILGMSVVREAIRLSTIDIEALYQQHEAATRVGGLFVFLAFFIVNAALIIWCFVLVRRNAQSLSR